MNHKLLITDDSMIIREMIKDVALQQGWEVVGEAANGQEAIDAFARLRPDVVTMDVVMPEFDGLHGLRGIRGLDHQARVLIVSAIDQKEVWKEALQLGAADCVIKPFNRDRLTRALRALFDDARGTAESDATNTLVGGQS
jgi:two-component system chemotaxis response regulator CheY